MHSCTHGAKVAGKIGVTLALSPPAMLTNEARPLTVVQLELQILHM